MNSDEKFDEINIRLRNLLNEYVVTTNEEIKKFNFVIDGNLDSFEIISFITDVELEFGINFTAEELANDEHHFFYGLLNLILRKIR